MYSVLSRLEETLSDPQGFWVTTSNTRLAPLDLVTPQSSTQALGDGIRRVLDDEVEAISLAMSLAMSSIRSRRNALSLPYRLPSEVLARCFWFLVAADPLVSRSSLGWIHILHVSAHFRHVALAEPTLWTEVSLILGLNWAERMASLAKAAPLSIKYAIFGVWTGADGEALRNVIHDHISHIRELDIMGKSPVVLADIVNIAEPAPVLETLSLRLPLYDISPGSRNAPQTSSAIFFSGSAPRLRTIELRGLYLSSTASPLLSTVVNLSIEHLTQPPSYDNFFSMLKAASRLESLNLEDCLPNATEDSSVVTSSSTLPISLPHLRKLRVHGLTADCAFLLRHLSLPCTTRLEICSEITERDRYEPVTTTNSHLVLFSALIPHIVRVKTSPRVRTLHISLVDSSDFVHVMAWELSGTQNDTETPFFSHDCEMATLLLRLRHSQYESVSGPALATLFDLSNLQALSLHIFGEILEIDEWTNALRPCTQLQHVLVTGKNGPSIEICCALLSAFHTEAENLAMAGPSTAEVFLPNLISLTLCRVDIGGYAPGHSGPFHEVLVDLLSERKAIGKPLHRLSLAECIVNGDWVGNLREVVSQVEWDREPRNMSEEDEEEDDAGGYVYDEDYDYYSDSSEDLDI